MQFHTIAFCSQLEATNDVISGVIVDPTGTDVHMKFGNFRLHRSRDIRVAQFVMNERRPTGPGVIGRNALRRFA